MANDTSKDDKGGEYYGYTESDCETCKHRSKVDPTLCVAYPNGIPIKILSGEQSHKKPIKGDNGIQWEKA